MIKRNVFIIVLCLLILSFFAPFFSKQKLPIPADTIVGLYNPFRDLYSQTNPNGIPFKNFLITDPVRQQYPWRLLAFDAEKKLQLPLWNPYNFSGAPLLANFQTAAFNPFNVVFFILPFPIAWSLLIIFQPLLAGIFMYLYIKHLGLSKSSAMLSGYVFAFCGFSTAWLEWGTILQTLLWLPLILYSTDKFFFQKERNYRNKKFWPWGILLIISLVCSFASGHLQTFFYVMLLFISYFIARSIQYRTSKSFLPLILILFTFSIVTFLSWYPVMQFIILSARDVYQLDSWKVEGWFIPWGNLVQFIAPDFFGNPTTLNYWGIWNYAEFVGYIGILPLIFALYALYNRQDKKTFFFGFFFFASLVFALPTFLAVIPYQLHIPFLSTTQPTRLLAITDFSLAILVGLGFDRFMYHKRNWKIIYTLVFVGLFFVFIWAYFIFGHSIVKIIPADKLQISKHNFYFPTIVYILSVLFVSLYIYFQNKKHALIKPLFLILLIGLCVFDLMRFSMKFNTFTNKEYLFPQTKTLSYLQNQQGQFRIMTTDDQLLPPNFSAIYKLQSLDGYDPLYLKNYVELIAAIDRNKPDISPPYGYKRIIAPHNVKSRFINLLGVKYILSLNQLSSKQFEKKMTEGQTTVYENRNVFPRAFFVGEVQSATDNQDAITKMFNPALDFKKTAIVQNWSISTTQYHIGTVLIQSYEDNQVVLSVNNQKDGYLVLMDTYYPSWKAEVCSMSGDQCNQTKIYKTNYNYRGILVPAGKYTVRFVIGVI